MHIRNYKSAVSFLRLAAWQSGGHSFCLDFLVLLYQDKSTKEKKGNFDNVFWLQAFLKIEHQNSFGYDVKKKV